MTYCKGRMKRRGHATTIYPITNGRGLCVKNLCKEFVPSGQLAKSWLHILLTHQYTL